MTPPGGSLVGWAIVAIAFSTTVIMIVLITPVIRRSMRALCQHRLQRHYKDVEAQLSEYTTRFPRGSSNQSFRSDLAKARSLMSAGSLRQARRLLRGLGGSIAGHMRVSY